MIDFKNAAFLKLRPVNEQNFLKLLGPLLVPGEQIMQCFQTVRDGVIFTNKRIISVNTQGVTGRKKDITSLPYSKIQAFSVETAGVLDLDSELEIWFSGLGRVNFEFTAHSDVGAICRAISEQVL